MGTFSFLSKSDRARLDGTAEEAAATGRDVDQNAPIPGLIDFPAKLTAYDAASGYYSWIRRAFDAGVRYDHPATVQAGTPTSNPARFPNGDVIDVSTPVDVWLRPTTTSAAVGMVHEVIAGPAATATTAIAREFGVSSPNPLPHGVPVAVATYSFADTGTYLVVPNITAQITGDFLASYGSWNGQSTVSFTAGAGIYYGVLDLLQRLEGTFGATGSVFIEQIGPPFFVRVDTAPATITIYVTLSYFQASGAITTAYSTSAVGNCMTAIRLG